MKYEGSALGRRDAAKATPGHRWSALTPLLVTLAVSAMLFDAMDVGPSTAIVRNACSGALVIVFVLNVMRGGPIADVGGIALAFVMFTGWAILRILYDTGLSFMPLTLVLWMPLVFFSCLSSLGSLEGTSASMPAYTLVASGIYLLSVLGGGLHGAPMVNAVYYSLLSLPFVLMLKTTAGRLAGVSIVFLAVMASPKRTALIALVLALVAYAVISALSSRVSNVDQRRPLATAVVLLLVAGGIYWAASARLGVGLLEKFSRPDEDNGSSRAEIYGWVLDSVGSGSLTDLFLGHGQDGVARATGGLSAHNDFLEILYDFGLVGLLLYLGLYVALLSVLRRLMRDGSRVAGAWGASIVLFGTMSSLSHVVFIPTYGALLAMFWGLAVPRVPSRRAASHAFGGASSASDDTRLSAHKRWRREGR